MRSARKEIIEVSHLLADKAWVANHDGNISVRLGSNRFLITPTATAKAKVSERNLIEVDAQGTKLSGSARPFSEFKMHAAIFKEREDVGAVLHAHPPYATALACTGSPIIETPFLAEAIVSLGPRIPTLPFAAPGEESVRMLSRESQKVDAVLLSNHGVFSWGPNLELAYLRMELVEHLARIATLAQATGGIQPLPLHIMPKLLGARTKANLGKAADRAMDFLPKTVVACAPAPHSNTRTISHNSSQKDTQLAQIIKEELAKLL